MCNINNRQQETRTFVCNFCTKFKYFKLKTKQVG